MKVTAVVTLSLAAALILLDFDPTTGIRLTNQYAEKTAGPHQSINSNPPQKQKVLQHGGGQRSGDSSSLSTDKSSPSSSTSSSADFKVDKRKVKRGKILQDQQQQQHSDDESTLSEMIDSGVWPMPVHFWNYLPHTNSINNNHHTTGSSGHNRHSNQVMTMGHHGLAQSDDEVEEEEEEEEEVDPLTRHRYSNPNNAEDRHHLSYIPDPDNGISINVASNEPLGQRLAVLNQHLFHEAAEAAAAANANSGGGNNYHDDDDHLHSHSPSLSILKRTGSHSDPATMGSRKTEDSKRANRPYDVPQIQCPPADDGMERFACPSPDRQGRYKCIDDHVLCDGFLDCPEGEDEDRHACMFYKTTKAHLDVLADALLRWARGKR